MSQELGPLPEARLWYDPETQRCSSMAPLRPTYEPLWDEGDMRAYAAAAVAAERERCAKLVETQDTNGNNVGGWFEMLAAKIRA